MRRLLFSAALFLSLLQISSKSYCQNTFAPVGAEWWYYSDHGDGFLFIYSLIQAKVTRDTLWDGQVCQVIEQERKAKWSHSYGGGPPVIGGVNVYPLRTLYVYDNEDTVFIYNPLFEKFTPLYIYNVNVGQTLCLPAMPDLDGDFSISPAGFGDSTFCMVVDSIATVLYDTSYLKTIYTHSLSRYGNNLPPGVTLCANWSFGDYKERGIYAKKIGGVRGGIIPKAQYYGGLQDEADPTGKVRLTCYQDSSCGIKVTDKDCDYLPATTSIPTLSQSDYGITIYPNPSKGIFNLTTQKPLKEALSIQVTDLSGRTMHTTALPAGKTSLQVDLGALQAGIYLLVLRTADHSYYQKITIQR